MSGSVRSTRTQQGICVAGEFDLKEQDMNLFTRFAKDESGATAIEYGLIAGLISVVCIAALTTVGTSLKAKFTAVSNNLT
jgi:pilus assembly protein Flp/PilA